MATLVGKIVEGPKVAIFGREPALWVGTIEALLTALLAFQFGVTPDSYGAWVAVVVGLGGLTTAWLTRDVGLSVIVGVLKAVVALVACYGLTLTDQQVGGLIMITSAVFAFIVRDRTSPVAAPINPSPEQVVQSPVGLDGSVSTEVSPQKAGLGLQRRADRPHFRHAGLVEETPLG